MKLHVWIALLFSPIWCLAGNIVYVNNLTGNDNNDGSDSRPVGTFKKAVALLLPGWTLSIVPSGKPYYESLIFDHISGTPQHPIIIEGNHAVISGLRILESGKWQLQNGHWVYKLFRMASNCNPYVVCDGHRLARGTALAQLKPMQFFWQDDSFYLNLGEGKTPTDFRLEGTVGDSGFMGISGSYLICRNLISESHANDGFNLHGNSRGNMFFDIESRYNGDDGFSIHEEIDVEVRNARLHHNYYGIQDINLSRSAYYNLDITDNVVGVNFLGGSHSLIDCRVINNQTNGVLVGRGSPGMNQGKSDAGQFFNGVCLIKNTVIANSPEGLTLWRRTVVTVTDSVIADCGIGVFALKNSALQMFGNLIANNTAFQLILQSTEFESHNNCYSPGRFKIENTNFESNSWEKFRAACGQEKDSLLVQVMFLPGYRHESGKKFGLK